MSKEWDQFRDSATPQEMAKFVAEQDARIEHENRQFAIQRFYERASDPNSDPSELMATAYRLGITTEVFAAHREREGEAAASRF